MSRHCKRTLFVFVLSLLGWGLVLIRPALEPDSMALYTQGKDEFLIEGIELTGEKTLEWSGSGLDKGASYRKLDSPHWEKQLAIELKIKLEPSEQGVKIIALPPQIRAEAALKPQLKGWYGLYRNGWLEHENAQTQEIETIALYTLSLRIEISPCFFGAQQQLFYYWPLGITPQGEVIWYH